MENKENLYDIVIHQELTQKEIVQSNTITLSKHSFTLMEKRAIYLIIMNIRQAMEGDIKLQENLFGDVYIRFSPNQVLKASKRYEEVYKALHSLKKKEFIINTNEEWKPIGIVEMPRHRKKENYFQIIVPKEIVQYFTVRIEEGGWTGFSGDIALTFKKTSTQRMYEICSQFKSCGGFYMKFNEFKEKVKIDTQKRYAKWSNVENDFLVVAKDELKQMFKTEESDLYFAYKQVKEGRKTIGISFKIFSSRKILDQELKLEDKLFHCKNWLNAMFHVKTKLKNRLFVKEIIKHITREPDKCGLLYNKLLRTMQNYSVEDQPKIVRTIIDSDFPNVQNFPN